MHNKRALLRKYFDRQCSPEDLRLLLDHLKEDREEDYQEVMDEIWSELQTYSSKEISESEAIYEGIISRIQPEKISSSLPEIQHVSISAFRKKIYRTAAVFTGFIISALLLYLLFPGNDLVIYETAYGETATIELPDQSVVILNGNSKVYYPKGWGEKRMREVWLEGEAFFSVKHTKDHQKFVVHTNDVEIKVLGTEFNVSNRKGNMRVTLSSGKIRLNAKKASEKVQDIVMHPGEQAVLTNYQELDVKKVDTRLYTSWKDKELIFDQKPVSEIISMIEETYGLKVILQEASIGQLELTGTLPANDVEALFGMLSEIFELNIIRKDDEVIISKN